MSGGSFGYLSPDNWIENYTGRAEMLAAMREHFPNAPATHAFELLIQQEAELGALASTLGPVWHAIEWWYSRDWGEEAAREAVADWQPPAGQAAPHRRIAGMLVFTEYEGERTPFQGGILPAQGDRIEVADEYLLVRSRLFREGQITLYLSR